MSSIEEELAGATAYAPNDWLPTLFSLHHIDELRSVQYIEQSPYHRDGRWDIPDFDTAAGNLTDVPGLDDPVDDGKHMNDQMQRRFMDIMQDIIHRFGLQGSRRVMMTESTEDEMDDVNLDYGEQDDPKFSTRPDLALLGQDKKYLPRGLDTYESRMVADDEERIELYRGSVAIGKVQRVQRRGVLDRELDKVATCARECFVAQPGRHFVYCFSLTYDTFRLFLFDRSGVVRSSALNVHAEGITFVRMVRFLVNPDLVSLGFDPSIFWDQGKRYIEVLSGTRATKYEVERVLYRSSSIFGRCTTCWSVREAGASQDSVVIKDGWRDDDFAQEAEFLKIADEANISAVARLLLNDESLTASPFTINSLRQRQGLPVEGIKERVFRRIVLEHYGPSIRHFTSGPHLLQILRDAIHGHYLLVKAGVLHRNISPDNILIGRTDDPNGQHGVLIDLEKATRCEQGKTPVDKEVPTGTFLFRSACSIGNSEFKKEGRRSVPHRHDFLDDLESFFWVFAWMIMVHNGPGLNCVVSENCETVEGWYQSMLHFPAQLSRSKSWYLRALDPDCVCITPYFSHAAYQDLHDRFRDLLQSFTTPKTRQMAPEDGTPGVELDFSGDLDTTYRQILAYFDAAIFLLQPIVRKEQSALQPPTRFQPKRSGKRSLHVGDNPPPAKRQRVGSNGKTLAHAISQENVAPCPEKPKPTIRPIPRYARPLPSTVRRSERLKSKKVLIPSNNHPQQ